jgi:hypothetical protein
VGIEKVKTPFIRFLTLDCKKEALVERQKQQQQKEVMG